MFDQSIFWRERFLILLTSYKWNSENVISWSKGKISQNEFFFFLNSKLLYWFLSEGIEMVSYFYNWYKNQHTFFQPRFSVYDNLSCVVVAENLCVLAHSKILSFKAIVACLRSFRPCRLDYQHRPDSRERRKTSQVSLPWIEYTTLLNHLNYFEGATHLSLLFILKWSLQYIHKRNRILNGTFLSPRALQIERTGLTRGLKLWSVFFCSTSIQMQICVALPLALTKANKGQIF